MHDVLQVTLELFATAPVRPGARDKSERALLAMPVASAARTSPAPSPASSTYVIPLLGQRLTPANEHCQRTKPRQQEVN